MKILIQNKKPQGFALFFAMLTLTVIAIIAMSLSSLTVSSITSIADRKDLSQSYSLAQNGIAIACSQLALNFDTVAGSQYLSVAPFSGASTIYYPPGSTASNATGQITVEILGLNADGTVTVRSTGRVLNKNLLKNGTVQDNDRMILAVFQKGNPTGFFPAGAFGQTSLFAHGTIYTDSYNSANGTFQSEVNAAPAVPALIQNGVLIHPAYAAGTLDAYDWSIQGDKGNIGSNGPISTVGALVIYGSATPGPTSTVTGGGTITGSTAPELAPYPLPDVTYTVPTTNITSISTPTATMSAGTYHISSWPSQNVTINGNVTVYLDGNFDQNGQKAITISSGGSLTLFMGGTSTFTLNGGGVINTDGNPNKFTVVSASTGAVKLAGGAAFYGNVYAKYAPVTVIGNAESFGAVIGDTVDLGGTAAWHWDMNAQSPAFLHPVQLVAWTEVDPFNPVTVNGVYPVYVPYK